MQPARSLAAALIALSLAGCATAPRQSTASAAAPPQRAPVANETIDMGLVRTAGSGLGVRPAFRACVETAAGAATATQACIDAELQHQQSRIDTALASRRGRSTSNGDVDAVQAQWRNERDRMCGPDTPGVPAAQRVQAGICRLEATAARADVLAR